mgnify:CR=1 FL=1
MCSEIVSILVLASCRTYIDAVKDFIALLILNDIDDHLFNYFKSDLIFQALITKGKIKVANVRLTVAALFEIEITSSKKTSTNTSRNEDRQIKEELSTRPIY